MRRLFMAAIAAAGLSVSLLSAPAAQAATAPQPEQLVASASVTVRYYAADDTTLISTVTYGRHTQGKALRPPRKVRAGYSTGKGGTSLASGCARATVNNHESTTLGYNAFTFRTWSHWCWNRSVQDIYDTQTGYQLDDVDGQYYWRGIKNQEIGFYDYGPNNGYPHSAFKNYQQGQFENCVVKYGCIHTYYPDNVIRAYYNGTWVWGTDGDAS